ncbi:hypothetical protein Cob_v010261 [Colletotrichum orbiculare MAFF 240422]|uniref:Uncharacterized protein n=1 Tax=Colletotrichum orbiculare (strain 104-T / ATCC 96160 / CBS 514.97 / LARS 414 / MAFF 240422) TaxID=1213857 RepID=A0A484FFU7_COLOR|nr:hypothetical protein Cob_v010261 [Colletotrichum orbiculare MAFF 240422]
MNDLAMAVEVIVAAVPVPPSATDAISLPLTAPPSARRCPTFGPEELQSLFGPIPIRRNRTRLSGISRFWEGHRMVAVRNEAHPASTRFVNVSDLPRLLNPNLGAAFNNVAKHIIAAKDLINSAAGADPSAPARLRRNYVADPADRAARTTAGGPRIICFRH